MLYAFFVCCAGCAVVEFLLPPPRRDESGARDAEELELDATAPHGRQASTRPEPGAARFHIGVAGRRPPSTVPALAGWP